jgi:hypothetical protein
VSLAVILGVLLTSILTSAIATRAVERAARHRKDLLSGDGHEDKG